MNTSARTVPSTGAKIRLLGIGALAVIATALFAVPIATASDYAHYCRSADGAYTMNDEELQAFDEARGQPSGAAIQYDVLSKHDLRRSKGYCVSFKDPDRRRYAYEGRSYALHIKFRHKGRSQEAFLICEFASSGLPALYNCDRDVKTLEWSASSGGRETPTIDGPKTRWSYEGSGIRIVAKGNDRRLVFVTPSEELRQAGARPGDPLFDGRREGKRYIGQAYAYSRRCGPVAYRVQGRIGEGERRVVVTGRQPVRDRNCEITGRRDVRLVFERNF